MLLIHAIQMQKKNKPTGSSMDHSRKLWQLAMQVEDKGDWPEKSKQMHLLRAKNGGGNKSSCSFRHPVFFR